MFSCENHQINTFHEPFSVVIPWWTTFMQDDEMGTVNWSTKTQHIVWLTFVMSCPWILFLYKGSKGKRLAINRRAFSNLSVSGLDRKSGLVTSGQIRCARSFCQNCHLLLIQLCSLKWSRTVNKKLSCMCHIFNNFSLPLTKLRAEFFCPSIYGSRADPVGHESREDCLMIIITTKNVSLCCLKSIHCDTIKHFYPCTKLRWKNLLSRANK